MNSSFTVYFRSWIQWNFLALSLIFKEGIPRNQRGWNRGWKACEGKIGSFGLLARSLLLGSELPPLSRLALPLRRRTFWVPVFGCWLLNTWVSLGNEVFTYYLTVTVLLTCFWPASNLKLCFKLWCAWSFWSRHFDITFSDLFCVFQDSGCKTENLPTSGQRGEVPND